MNNNTNKYKNTQRKTNSNYFNEITGFGEHKQTAIDLMHLVINILNKLNLDYFLISGTLLGLVRHNDFIPWDDDIDLIVHNDILKYIDLLQLKFNKILIIENIHNYLIKISFRNKGIKLTKNKCNFPFIDLFTYYLEPPPFKRLHFFKKMWDYDKFYPPIETTFLNITVKIPKIPDYFLHINYGDNYMTVLKSSSYSHKEEKHIHKVKHKDISNKHTTQIPQNDRL